MKLYLNMPKLGLAMLLMSLHLAADAQTSSLTLFAHGILDTGRNQIQNYAASGIIAKPYAYFNFDDACEPKYGIKLCKFWHCSFGQDNDIKTLARAYDNLATKFPTQSLVLYGVSRGASVIWSFIANQHPKQIKALVLESPFDRIQTSLQAAADHVPAIINYGFTRHLAQIILRTIACKYKVDALQPIDLADKIPLDLPILIICSLEDKLVPATSSYALYEALKKRGHQHAYIVVLPKGKHAKLLHGASGQQYEAAVHAFYKKYGLK